jgi:hypothetical protein
MLNLQPSTYLRLSEWREDNINLVGATQSITVRFATKGSWGSSRLAPIPCRFARLRTRSRLPRRL